MLFKQNSSTHQADGKHPKCSKTEDNPLQNSTELFQHTLLCHAPTRDTSITPEITNEYVRSAVLCMEWRNDPCTHLDNFSNNKLITINFLSLTDT